MFNRNKENGDAAEQQMPKNEVVELSSNQEFGMFCFAA